MNFFSRCFTQPHFLKNATVRSKLLLVALLPFLIMLPILFALMFYWGMKYYDRLLTFKVGSDLAIAHEYFNYSQDRIGSDVASLGISYKLVTAAQRDDRQQLQQLLNDKKTALGLDFMHFLNATGEVQVSTSAQQAYGQENQINHAYWPVVSAAMQGRSFTAIDIYSAKLLRELDPQLAQQAHLELVQTQNALPINASVETRGMMIHTAAPVRDEHGNLLGVLEAGMLLNQNLDFVDTINSLVYAEGSLPAGSVGTATLFIDDVRIATNVRLFGDQRALGTRASQSVRSHVLDQGNTWLDSAFVVHDWYISAYESVSDSYGKRVGMLYVGYLETPFRQIKENVIAIVAGLFLLIGIGGIYFSLRVARDIYGRVLRMNRTMQAVEAGDLSARTGAMMSSDEITHLSQQLDALLDTLHKQNDELKNWGEQLDRKVIERTAELERANQLLVQAQQQLLLSEKLASIGELTAGMAHEINNPVAVLQGNLDVLRDMLGAAAKPVAGELDLIDQQIHRITTIVNNLLQFANPDEYAGYVEAIHVDEVVDDSLVLVRHLLVQENIQVQHISKATHEVRMNRTELQQVFINLFTNAAYAMKGGGTLTIESDDWCDDSGAKGVSVRVGDTGPGIKQQELARIFDAFFTTKQREGTGLGLSITYTLVARYGGSITASSEVGVGSEFIVRLPACSSLDTEGKNGLC